MAKPLINMDGHKHGIGGYNYGCRCNICKEAKSVKRKEYQSSKSWEYRKSYLQRMRENDPEKYRAWLDKNNAYKKASFQANPEKHRWMMIHKKYKLTKQMYLDLLKQQNGVCAICKNPPKRQWLAVDHDHSCCPSTKTCGECIRGLLCGSCNSFLGRVNDNPQYLLDYLRKGR
jgi:hypothetical protein